MKTRHSIVVKPQIKLTLQGDVSFLAISTNVARMGVRAGQLLTQEKFCAKFCDVQAGDSVRLRWIGTRPNGRWVIADNPHPTEEQFNVTSVRLQRLNEMTEDDLLNEEFGTTSRISDRQDNPFLFVLKLQPAQL